MILYLDREGEPNLWYGRRENGGAGEGSEPVAGDSDRIIMI